MTIEPLSLLERSGDPIATGLQGVSLGMMKTERQLNMGDKRNKQLKKEVMGLIPAAGRATRIAQLPCSKEVYPVGFETGGEGNTPVPKVVCHYLLEKMRLAGVTRAFIVLREGKWDIPAYLSDGTLCDMDLAYLLLGLPYGVPYTVDQAYNFVKEAVIAFGFPDISAAMQRSKGKLLPLGIFDLLLEMRRTKMIAGNGLGMLPEFQGRGGNALLYVELENTLRDFNFEDCELTQVAETAVQMRKDLETLGGVPYKNHRVFSRTI